MTIMIEMHVTELWTRIVLWLGEHAPVTAAALSQPSAPVDSAGLAGVFEVEIPSDLCDWWSCCGGTVNGDFAEVLPPFYTPYSAEQALDAWQAHRKNWWSRWDRPACDYWAGSAGSSFHPAWIPIAGDGFADELIVDLRPGPLQGCVLEWEQEAAQVHRPEWSSVLAMLTDVHRALLEGTPCNHSHRTVTQDGRLDWQIR